MEEKIQNKPLCSIMKSEIKSETGIGLVKSEEPIDVDLFEENRLKRKNEETEKSQRKRRMKVIVKEESSSSEEEVYGLTVSNLPKNWSYLDIKHFFDAECGTVDEIEMLKHTDGGNAVGLSFLTLDRCKKAMQCLKDKSVSGQKLVVKMNGSYDSESSPETKAETQSADSTENSNPEKSPIPVSPKEEDWDPKDHELYGLRPQLLKSLGIVPPLAKWIHVSNFRCDKSELRNVLELAGNVLIISVMSGPNKFAKVMYSHPLEAVQAVSMLNGQEHFGNPLKIKIESNPSDVYILPKGLNDIGLGLGPFGKPIRDIEKQYRKLLKGQETALNPILFKTKTEDDTSNDVEEINKKIKDLIASSKTQTERSFHVKNAEDFRLKEEEAMLEMPVVVKPVEPKPKPQRKTNISNETSVPSVRMTKPAGPRSPLLPIAPRYRPQAFNQPRPGPFGQGPGPYVRNYGPQPIPGPYVPRTVPMAHTPMTHTPMPTTPVPHRPMGSIMPRPVSLQSNHVTVQLFNLPPSTTFPLLCERLAQCGQVMSVQLTTPGCALATFSQRSFADRCYQNFNGSNIDGYVVTAKVL